MYPAKSIIAISPDSTFPSLTTTSAYSFNNSFILLSTSSLVTFAFSFLTFKLVYSPSVTSGSVIKVNLTSKVSLSHFINSTLGSIIGVILFSPSNLLYSLFVASSAASKTISCFPYFFSKISLGALPGLKPSILAFLFNFSKALFCNSTHSFPSNLKLTSSLISTPYIISNIFTPYLPLGLSTIQTSPTRAFKIA